MPNWLSISLLIIVLIAFNALYVLSEFSTVSARRARISQQAENGNRQASYILSIIENPTKLDAYVATSQVGITLSSLILGFVGQGQLAEILTPLFLKFKFLPEAAAHSISAIVILFILSLFQVLLGELIPKKFGIQEPERFAVLTSQPLRWSSWVFKPLIWLFNGSGILLMRMIGVEHSGEHGHIHSPEEIALLVEESGEGGAISQDEQRLLSNTLRMREAMVKQVMIPRANMLAIPDTLTPDEAFRIISDSPYSRLPVYHDTIDRITHIIHLRDLFCASRENEKKESLENYLRPLQIVPESMQVKDVFDRLQQKRHLVAIVLDEFGGTAGMVTLEDLIEEIFGDLQDEFDKSIPDILKISATQVRVRGDYPISELNDLLDLAISNETADTIGGLVMAEIGHIPIASEKTIIQGFAIVVESMKSRAINSLLISLPESAGREARGPRMIATYVLPSIIILILILLNGLFVAAEFAIVTASKPKLKKSAEAGSNIAGTVLAIATSPDLQNRFITTAQVGITLVSLGLGMYGEHVFAEWLVEPLHQLGDMSEAAAHSIATVLAVSMLTYLHVVIGEMIPKSFALQTPNKTVTSLYVPMRISDRILSPLVSSLNAFSNFVLNKAGYSLSDTESRLFTPDDLEFIVEESTEREMLDQTDSLFIENILDLEDRFAEQAMTPRNRIETIPLSATTEEIYQKICSTNKTRYPVYNQNLDDIIGIVHIKELARWQINYPGEAPDLRKICRPALFIPEMLPLSLLLQRFQEMNEQLAITLDEFGGVAGIVSLEDLIEEVVGEIQDEFDQETLPIDELADGILRIRGDVILAELEQLYDFTWDHDLKAVTIGGLVMAALGEIPVPQNKITIGNAELTVEEIEGMAVKSVLVKFLPQK